MLKLVLNWLKNNWKELVFFLMTWTIGWYLFFLVISKISPNDKCLVCPIDWTIFFTSLFLLFLPFVKKIEFGKIFKIEKEVNATKEELKGFKSETNDHFKMLLSSINIVSQNVSNKNIINNYNQEGKSFLDTENASLHKVKKKILKTLWYYQKLRFPNPEERIRWSFTLSVNNPYYTEFTQAIKILSNEGLVRQSPDSLQFSLTDPGYEYCETNEHDLGDDKYEF